MDLTSLTAVGLSPQQAAAYALLIEHGSLKPAQAAQQLGLTRTNCYKILDKLAELGLAQKADEGKTLAYSLSNPIALSNLTAHYRAEATAREEAANKIMQDLMAQYHVHADKPGVEVFTGRKAVASAYRQQANLKEDIYFIHTRADVPAMGFDTMHEIRIAPAQHGMHRYGLLSHSQDTTPVNYELHRRSNLDITWLEREDYTAPVEWSVTDSSLLIVLYVTEPHAILILDPVVAAAFKQIWKLVQSLASRQPAAA